MKEFEIAEGPASSRRWVPWCCKPPDIIWLPGSASSARAPQLMSVNLSRAQIIQPTLVAEVQHALRASGIAPDCLQLEITASLAAENPISQARLHELKALGVVLALDDFGTGHSSLASLHL